MPHRAITALAGILRPHVGLSKSRLETLCLLVVGMVSARTVNLGHIACERPGTALVASTYRRLQRFFQHVRLGQDWAVPLVVGAARARRALASRARPDAVEDRDARRELSSCSPSSPGASGCRCIWSLLPQRRQQLDRGAHRADAALPRASSPAASIRLLLADREFVGAEWMKFLNDNNIPFAIRLREELRVTAEDGRDLTLFARLRRAAAHPHLPRPPRARDDAEPATRRCSTSPPSASKDEWLIVVSNIPPRAALAAYRKRWAIECLFGDAKTRGLNLEDTRLTDPRKLAPAHGPRRPRPRLGRPHRRRPPRTPRPQPQGPRIPRQVLVPHRLRPHPKPAQNRPARRRRRMAQTIPQTSQKTESRVVWAGAPGLLDRNSACMKALAQVGGSFRSAGAGECGRRGQALMRTFSGS